MKGTKPISKNNTLVKFAIQFPHIILITIIFGFIFAFTLGRFDFAIRGFVIAIPGFFAALTLKYIYNNHDGLANIPMYFNISQKNIIYLFICFYILSLIINISSTSRPVCYFVIMLVLSLIVMYQILADSTNKNIILVEIFLCSINLIYGVTLNYPLYFGATDILPHLVMSQVTYISGHIIPKEMSGGYASFPLFHILITQASYLLNLSLKDSYFIISAPIFSISIFFVYYIFFIHTKNIQLSLLTTLVYSNLSVVIFYGMYMVTRVAAYVAFLIILYCIYKKQSITYKLLIIVFTLFIILVHQVSAPQIFLIFILVLLSETIVAKTSDFKKRYLTNNYVILFFVAFVGYWFLLAFSFTNAVIKSRFTSLTTDSIAVQESIQAGNQWLFLIQNIDLFIITFFVFIGIGVLLWRYSNTYLAVLSLVALFSLPFYLPNPLQTLWQTMTLFRFDRFMLLISPFIAFSMAFGIISFYRLLNAKYKNSYFGLLLLIILVSMFIFPSLLSNTPEANDIDSNRKYFTNTELIGFDFVFNYVPNGSTIVSDHYVRRYFFYPKLNESNALGMPYYERSIIEDINKIDLDEGFFVLRAEHLSKHGLNLGEPKHKLIVTKKDLYENSLFYAELTKKNKIYSNFNVCIYGGSK